MIPDVQSADTFPQAAAQSSDWLLAHVTPQEVMSSLCEVFQSLLLSSQPLPPPPNLSCRLIGRSSPRRGRSRRWPLTAASALVLGATRGWRRWRRSRARGRGHGAQTAAWRPVAPPPMMRCQRPGPHPQNLPAGGVGGERGG